MTKYVIRCIDLEYPGKHYYCIKDCIPVFGSSEFFSEDCCFDTAQEAEEHITTMLESGWYRPDITRDNFEVVEVKQYEGLDFGFFYYTEKGYEEFKEYKR